MKSLSRVWLFATPWTVAYQAPPSMGFSRQECWSVLPFPSPGDLPDPGIEPGSPTLQADALLSEPPGKQSTFKVKPCPQDIFCLSGVFFFSPTPNNWKQSAWTVSNHYHTQVLWREPGSILQGLPSLSILITFDLKTRKRYSKIAKSPYLYSDLWAEMLTDY